MSPYDDIQTESHRARSLTRTERRLLCARCGATVTSARARIVVSGRHEHAYLNPAGIVYRFGCFRAAPGADARGLASGEWSWFAGYRWRVVDCTACAAHLGWRFDAQGGGDGFYALILDRLREE